jgi:hypothetical protein
MTTHDPGLDVGDKVTVAYTKRPAPEPADD